MSLAFRLLLIIGAFAAFYVMIRNIRKSRLQVGDSVFWTLFAILLVLLAVIPEIADFFGHIFGILSTVNLVYLVIITILIYRVFSLTLRISEMDGKLTELARKIALEEADKRNSERH